MTFLTVGDTLALHEEVIKVSGGSAGVRDMGAVESAVAQPQVTFGGQKLYSTLDEKAAALSFSLVKNHAFVDGNKRIGWVAMRVFLYLNGRKIDADTDEAERAVMALAAGEMSREGWTQWVSEHLVPSHLQNEDS